MSPWAASARSAKASHALRGTSNECEAAIAASWHDFMPLLPGCINPVLQPRCVFSDIVLAGRGALSQSPVRSSSRHCWRAPPAYMLCAMSTAHDVARRCSSEETRPGRSISCSRPIWSMSATSFIPTASPAISSSTSPDRTCRLRQFRSRRPLRRPDGAAQGASRERPSAICRDVAAP